MKTKSLLQCITDSLSGGHRSIQHIVSVPGRKSPLRLVALLALLLMLGVQGVWGGTITLSWASSNTGTVPDAMSEDETTFSNNGITYGYKRIKYSSTYNTIILNGSTSYPGVFYNKTAIPGTIDSLELKYTSGTSESSKIDVTYNTSAISARTTAVDKRSDQLSVTKSSTVRSICSVSNASYFNITLDGSSNVQIQTITIYYTPPTRTVTWYVNGESTTAGSPSTRVVTGNKVTTLPTAPTSPDRVKYFVGWTGTEIDGNTDTEPTDLFASLADAPTITKDTAFYAVFATLDDTYYEYHKITYPATEGVYVLVSECTTSAFRYMPNTTSSGSNPSLASGITMTTSGKTTKLTNEIADAMLWDLTTAGVIDTFYVRPHGDATIGLGTTASTGENIRISKTYKDNKWAFQNSVSKGWQIRNNNATAMYLAVYSDANWRNYTSSVSEQNGKFYLFKKTLVHDYSNYATTCCTAHDITLTSSGGVIGGSFETNLDFACSGTTVSLTVSSVTDGYSFTGWSVTDTETGETEVELNDDDDEDGKTRTFTMPAYGVTVSAEFEVDGDGYTITLDKNGGDSEDGEAAVAANATSVTSKSDPTKTGYSVEGYYLEAECENLVLSSEGDFEASVEGWTDGDGKFTKGADGKLYTKWAAIEYTITLDKGAKGSADQVMTIDYDADAYTTYTTVSSTGYNLDGYYDDTAEPALKVLNADGSFAASTVSGYITDNQWKKAADCTLTAHWTAKTTTITFDNNSATSAGTTTQANIFDQVPADITCPKKLGYAFVGYETSKNVKLIGADGKWSKPADNDTYMRTDNTWKNASANITLYAIWTPAYRVTWAVDGMEYHIDSVATGEKVANMPTPPSSLNEYVNKLFVGWLTETIDGSTDTDGTFRYVEDSPDITADITFHAVFGDKKSTSEAAGAVILQECFYGYSTNDTPDGPDSEQDSTIVHSSATGITYSYADGVAYGTKIYAENALAGAVRPEMVVGGKNIAGDAATGKFIINDIPTLGATEITLRYRQNGNPLAVSISEINGESAAVAIASNDKKNQYAYTIPCADYSTIAITFNATGTYNVRLDNIEIFVKRPTFENMVTNSWHSDIAGDPEEEPTELNWGGVGTWPKGAAPTIEDTVVLSNVAMTVNVTNAKAAKIVLKDNATLTIGAGKALIVATDVKSSDGETLSATGVNDIVIESTLAAGTGALVMGNDDGHTKATVNFASKAKKDGSGNWINQFIGTPYNDVTDVQYNYYGMQLYEFKADGSGTTTSEWTKLRNGDSMTPFMGYNLLCKQTSDQTLWMQGTLNASTEDVALPMHYNGSSKTENMFANSWTAPIDITAFETSDFGGGEATIYIFNAGSPADQEKAGDGAANATSPGQYIVLPIAAATWLSSTTVTVIPSMQAFSVYATAANQTLTLDYEKLVYDPAVAGTAGIVPTRAPRRAKAEEDAPNVLRLAVNAASGYGDRIVMLEREDFTEDFDNGWDGRKLFGDDAAPQLYAVTADGNMAIHCTPELEGTLIGFKAGEADSEYTFAFEYDGDAEALYLLDTYNNAYTRVLTGNSYHFGAADNAAHNRFILTHYAPGVATGVENGELLNGADGVRKVLIDDQLYIFRAGKMFNATGALVK